MKKENLKKHNVNDAFALDIDTDEVFCNDRVMSLVEYFLVKGQTIESITKYLYKKFLEVAKNDDGLYGIWKDGFNNVVKGGIKDFVEYCDKQRGKYGLYVGQYDYENARLIFLVEDGVRFRLLLTQRMGEYSKNGYKN